MLKVLRNKISTILVRADRSLLRTGTTILNDRTTVTRLRQHVPVLIDIAIRAANAVLLKSRVNTTLATLRPLKVSTVNLGYTANPTRVNRRLHRLDQRTKICLAYVPGTKLPRLAPSKTQCPLAPKRLTRTRRAFIDSCKLGLVNKYYKAAPRRLHLIIRQVRSHNQISQRPSTPTSIDSLCRSIPLHRSTAFLAINRHAGTGNSGTFQRTVLSRG